MLTGIVVSCFIIFFTCLTITENFPKSISDSVYGIVMCLQVLSGLVVIPTIFLGVLAIGSIVVVSAVTLILFVIVAILSLFAAALGGM